MALFMRGQVALAEVEKAGIRIDVPYLDRMIEETGERAKELEAKLKGDPAFKIWRREFGSKANLGSDAQLGRVVYGSLGYPCTTYTYGGAKGEKRPSTSEEALKNVDLPFVRDWLEWQRLKDKVHTTYLKGIRREVVDGFLHPSFNLNTVISFRSSSSSPNFQNIPVRDPKYAKLIRTAFIPRDGCLIIENDFKAAEVTLACIYTGDPVLAEYITNPKKDMHRDCAQKLFFCKGQPREWWKKKGPGGGADVRYTAKGDFVFASFYGSYYIQTAQRMWDQMEEMELAVGDVPMREWMKQNGIGELGDMDPNERPRDGTFEKHVKEYEDWYWNEQYVVYSQWKRDWYQAYLNNGYFDTLTGFHHEGYFSRNQVLNYPIQGSSFHCLLWVMCEMIDWLKKNKMRSRVIGQIHDSLIADVARNEKDDYLQKLSQLVRVDIRKHWPWITVPLTIECELAYENWFSKSEFPMPV